MVFNEEGRLYARAFTAGGALPVEGVLVRIRSADEENRGFERSFLTDRSGLTPSVSLPTPPKSLSAQEGATENPYALYDVEVLAEGFYKKEFYNVAVFSGVESVLPVQMIPLGDYVSGGVIPEGNLDVLIYENEYL